MNFLSVALIALVVGLAVLFTMVRYDLGPKGRLAKSGQWFLATALGTGILSLAVKLMIILTVTNFPGTVIEPFIEQPDVEPVVSEYDPLLGIPASKRFLWQSLDSQPIAANQVARSSSPYVWQTLPDQAPAPENNPMTSEKVVLGKRLFFDKNLSWDRTLSCSSCHDVIGGSGDDGLPTSRGINNQLGGRNAPTVWNAAFQSVLFWDGRAASLEEQAKGPLFNPIEMGMPSWEEVVQRVLDDPAYVPLFADAFGADTAIDIERIAEAIASYERTLITPDAPYDRFVRGDLDALSAQQLRGMASFQTLGCVNCHTGPNFSGASLFDSRAPLRIFPIYPTPFEQQYELTRDTGAAMAGSGRGSWRVPSLRNVALTGPWLHNGSVSELKEVVRIMSSVQLGHTGRYLVWSDDHKVMTKLDRPALSDGEIEDIVAFLQSLSSDMLLERIKLAKGSTDQAIVAH
ncbi:cytochrome-c peroxidase [Candidatus Thiodiazotropha endoloripes]|uniref:cytochrome-c peroxidase n=1 Tax=Candidatus Thiodiazotropha endoloripes TaxID=1818881 RepID=UPI001F35DFC2|nr:cytochrome c peroxidase [Candidatus Thiodiazotropha endoloripes]